mmetsp:Transcript_3764/g.12560  ORF Transcript_3764/g.12560 Transcript_3764/m.12560 type:complete len:207 (-) Transcript_3764:192-812(-)
MARPLGGRRCGAQIPDWPLGPPGGGRALGAPAAQLEGGLRGQPGLRRLPRAAPDLLPVQGLLLRHVVRSGVQGGDRGRPQGVVQAPLPLHAPHGARRRPRKRLLRGGVDALHAGQRHREPRALDHRGRGRRPVVDRVPLHGGREERGPVLPRRPALQRGRILASGRTLGARARAHPRGAAQVRPRVLGAVRPRAPGRARAPELHVE